MFARLICLATTLAIIASAIAPIALAGSWRP